MDYYSDISQFFSRNYSEIYKLAASVCWQFKPQGFPQDLITTIISRTYLAFSQRDYLIRYKDSENPVSLLVYGTLKTELRRYLESERLYDSKHCSCDTDQIDESNREEIIAGVLSVEQFRKSCPRYSATFKLVAAYVEGHYLSDIARANKISAPCLSNKIRSLKIGYKRYEDEGVTGIYVSAA